MQRPNSKEAPLRFFIAATCPVLRHKQTIGIIAHKLCRLVWKILHQGIQYEERGPEVKKASKQKRTRKMIQALRRISYRIEPSTSQSVIPHDRHPRLGTIFDLASGNRKSTFHPPTKFVVCLCQSEGMAPICLNAPRRSYSVHSILIFPFAI